MYICASSGPEKKLEPGRDTRVWRGLRLAAQPCPGRKGSPKRTPSPRLGSLVLRRQQLSRTLPPVVTSHVRCPGDTSSCCHEIKWGMEGGLDGQGSRPTQNIVVLPSSIAPCGSCEIHPSHMPSAVKGVEADATVLAAAVAGCALVGFVGMYSMQRLSRSTLCRG